MEPRNEQSLFLRQLILNIINSSGTSLVVQWLRLCLPMQGVQVQSVVEELRSRVPHGPKNKTSKRKRGTVKLGQIFILLLRLY